MIGQLCKQGRGKCLMIAKGNRNFQFGESKPRSNLSFIFLDQTFCLLVKVYRGLENPNPLNRIYLSILKKS